MSQVTFEEVYEMAEQLTPGDKTLLIEKLQSELSTSFDYGITREELLAEMEQLRATGAFNHVESLYGKYYNPDVDISEEDFNSTIREIRDQWKEDLEELNDDGTD